MLSQSENTKRIAKNTMMLYARMLLSMVVSLYTSRVILQALGVQDYGIYNVVGGLVAMFAIVSSSLSSAASRFLTFEMGKGDLQGLKTVFTTSVYIHVALAVVVLALMEWVGLWFLNSRMTIPDARMEAANWVFQASVFSFAINLTSVPYNACIVAHERMSAFAYIGMLDIGLRLAAVVCVAHLSWFADRLVAYAFLLLGVCVVIRVISVVYCRRCFVECRLDRKIDVACCKKMGAFAGWNFIGCSAALLRDHGVNLLLNIFAGPILNAARGIAMTVNSAVCSLAGNFMMALNPQITKSYASGERAYMMSLVERGARFSFYILLMFTLPVLMETDFILTLWLRDYPAHTANFVRLVLLLSMVDILSSTLIVLQNATGKIRNYQLAVGGAYMLNFPLSYLCLKAGLPPESVFVVAISVALCSLMLRLMFLRRGVGLSVRGYVRNVCVNVAVVSMIALPVPMLCRMGAQDGWLRFALVGVTSVICSCVSIIILGCSHSERRFIVQRAAIVLNRFRR